MQERVNQIAGMSICVKRSWILRVIVFVLAGFAALSGNMVQAETAAGTSEISEPADNVIYDAADFEVFQGRTKEEVGRKYGEALYAGDSYVNGDSSTYYKTPYSLEAPYAAGEITEDTHKTMTAMTGFYRWLVGVAPLSAPSVHSDKLQAEALVRNFEFNHAISDSSKPEDMEQDFWDYGAKNFIHNILAIYSTPRNSITSWMNEGYSLSYGRWDTIGHRYALIGATVSDLQFGYAGSIAIGQEKAYGNTMNNPFYAFPAPGYMPANLVYSSSSAWSIQINRSQLSIANTSGIVVKVTNLDTSESYECTAANGKLTVSTYDSALAFVQPGPVSGNRYTGSYRVDVTGLTDVDSGKAAVLTYTTEFFDPTEYTPSYVKTVTADEIEKYIIYETTATTENLQKIAYALPSEVTVVAENGRRAQVPVTGKWMLNEEEHCWTNRADATKLPSDISDREHVLDNCKIYYEISDSMYDSYNTLRFSSSVLDEGDALSMYVYLTLISADTSAIFQLVPQEDGTYIGTKKYDSRTSEGFEETSSGNHVYNISSVQKSDEGEYFSIYYNSSTTYAYVSTQIKTLTVHGSTQSGGESQNPGGSGSETPGGSSGEVTPGGSSGGTTPGGSSVEVTPGGSSGSGTSGGSSGEVTPGGSSGSGTTGGSPKGQTADDTDDDSDDTVPSVANISSPKWKVSKTGKKKTLVLQWKKVAGASGYQIQISAKKNFKGAQTISLKKGKTKYKTNKLKSNKKYYVRLRAYRSYKDKAGKTKKVYGKWKVIRI